MPLIYSYEENHCTNYVKLGKARGKSWAGARCGCGHSDPLILSVLEWFRMSPVSPVYGNLAPSLIYSLSKCKLRPYYASGVRGTHEEDTEATLTEFPGSWGK